MADAAHAVLTGSNVQGSGLAAATGNFYTDERCLPATGVTDFRPYSLGAAEDRLVPDIFLLILSSLGLLTRIGRPWPVQLDRMQLWTAVHALTKAL